MKPERIIYYYKDAKKRIWTVICKKVPKAKGKSKFIYWLAECLEDTHIASNKHDIIAYIYSIPKT